MTQPLRFPVFRILLVLLLALIVVSTLDLIRAYTAGPTVVTVCVTATEGKVVSCQTNSPSK